MNKHIALISAAIGLTLSSQYIASADYSTKAVVKDEGSYEKVITKAYSFEAPKGWEVTAETSFGQREILPKDKELAKSGSAFSSMTGPGLGRQSWDQLYKTSLFFITRSYGDRKVTPTAVKMIKTKLGYEAATWNMLDEEKNIIAKYVVLKSTTFNILALSVKAGKTENLVKLEQQFQHMIDTASLK